MTPSPLDPRQPAERAPRHDGHGTREATALTERMADVLEQAVIAGDLSKLTPEQRVTYYHQVCQSTGLNPLTRPFDYIVLNGKLTLYARRDAADQLRKRHAISIQITSRDQVGDIYIVTAQAATHDGRRDESTGAVPIKGLQGEKLANALMKAETKAKRRVTLSIAGLGWLDESEVDSIPGARRVEGAPGSGEPVPTETCEIAEEPPPARGNGHPALTIGEKFTAYTQYCQSVREKLGAECYYEVLRDFDLGHCEDVTPDDEESMKLIMQALRQALRDAYRALQDAEEDT